MAEQLKVVIDADVSKAESKIVNFGKAFTGQLKTITNSANALSTSVATSIDKINASLSSLKVTSVDISVDTSAIDASVQSIKAKFADLTNPEINVLANTQVAEAKIKVLLAELSSLKGSEIFIRANDTQALQKINEIEKELNSLVGKQIKLSVSADLSKIQQLQEKINSLKVTPVEVVVNTSLLDSQIKNIQSKFATLVDPQINVLANTAQAEAQIKELISELGTLKGSEIFITANDAQALKVINEVEAELNSLIGKKLTIDINASKALSEIKLIETEIAGLQKLKISPDVSTTQFALFQKNIDQLKSKLNELKGKDVGTFVFKADASQLLSTIKNVETATKKVGRGGFDNFTNALGKATTAATALQSKTAGLNNFFGQVVTSSTKAANALSKIPNTSGAATQSLINLSRVAQDAPFGFLGIANNINPLIESFQRLKASAKETGTSVKSALVGALTGPAGVGLAVGVASSLLLSFGDDLLKLISPSTKLSDALDAAGEALTKNVGQVTVYVEALKSGTLSTEQTKKVQKELIDQAPEFQSAFKGNAVNVEELDRILATKYIPQLVKSIKVTAAFGIVNETLAKSIKQIAKGGQDFSFGDKVQTFLAGFGGIAGGIGSAANTAVKNIKEAEEDLTTDNISKLIEKTFKSLGISLSDAADTITTGGKKVTKALKDDTLERARAFIKEFGEVFVVPDLEITFTNTEAKVKAAAKKLISDIDKGLLIGKTFGTRIVNVPIELALQVDDKGLKNDLKTLRDNLFKDANIFGDTTKIIKGLVPGVDKDVADRNKKFFDDFQKQILATSEMVTGVLAPAFTGMFDAIVAGESPLKAFFKGLIDSVNQLIKKLIAAAIQAAILSAISGGTAGGFGSIFKKLLGLGSVAGGGGGFGLGGQIAGRSFQNTLNVVVQGQISGQTILLAGQRAAGSNIR